MIADEELLQSQIRFLERENRALRRDLRDGFAMAALTGLLAQHGCAAGPRVVLEVAYEYAAAALEVRQ